MRAGARVRGRAPLAWSRHPGSSRPARAVTPCTGTSRHFAGARLSPRIGHLRPAWRRRARHLSLQTGTSPRSAARAAVTPRTSLLGQVPSLAFGGPPRGRDAAYLSPRPGSVAPSPAPRPSNPRRGRDRAVRLRSPLHAAIPPEPRFRAKPEPILSAMLLAPCPAVRLPARGREPRRAAHRRARGPRCRALVLLALRPCHGVPGPLRRPEQRLSGPLCAPLVSGPIFWHSCCRCSSRSRS